MIPNNKMDQYSDGIFFRRLSDNIRLLIKKTTKKLDFIIFNRDIKAEKGGFA